MFAFKCRNCGHLEDSANAGERQLPTACRNCGYGVHFTLDTGVPVKHYDDDNWIVLDDLTTDELHDIGLKRNEVERHVPAEPSGPEGSAFIERTAEDGREAEDSIQ